MTPDQFAYLQAELWQIKVAVLVTGFSIIVLCALAVIRAYAHVKRYVRSRLDDLFRDEANELLEKGDIAAVKAMARGKLKDRPNHADAHWYLAKAHYLDKEWSAALAEFEITRKLIPYWDTDYIRPYMAEIERTMSSERCASAAAKPER
jgi:hypothetical protein